MDEQLKQAASRAMKLLTRMDYTEYDLRRKLLKYEYPGDVIDKAIEYVSSFGYIDDLRYAGNYIRSNSGIRSRREIEHRLAAKGVAPEVIEEALNNEYTDEDTEDELIRKLIHKRCNDLSNMDHAARQKLYAYMYNRGFGVDRVRRILDELLLDITSQRV